MKDFEEAINKAQPSDVVLSWCFILLVVSIICWFCGLEGVAFGCATTSVGSGILSIILTEKEKSNVHT